MLTGQELLNSNLNGRDGIQHLFRYLKENAITTADVEKIGYKFPDANICANCSFDVELVLSDGQPIKHLEFKSYQDVSGIDLKQLKEYLSQITDLNQLKYIFNPAKLNSQQAKDDMKAFLKSNAKPVFDANPSLFKSLDKADGTGKIADWEDLYNLANSNIANNPLVSFVESL